MCFSLNKKVYFSIDLLEWKFFPLKKKKKIGLLRFSVLDLQLLITFIFQVPFYVGELTEKVADDDRLRVLKVSQAKLKVNTVCFLKHIL